MKRNALLWLVALNVALVLFLAALWLHRDGSLRNVHWQAPQPLTSNYLQMLPVLPERARVDTARFMSWLERPLFSITRRPPPPPPPPPPPAAEAPVDTLSTAKLHGIFSGGQTGGVILHIGGKNRRVRLDESVDGWVLRSVQGRSATFSSPGQTRTLQLTRAAVSTYVGVPVPPPPAPPSPSAVPAALSQAAAVANASNEAAAPPVSPAPPVPQPSTPRRSRFGP